MCRLLLTIVAVVAIAQLSLQATLPNNEHLMYSFRNLGPDDTQKLDIVKISHSNQANLETTFSEDSELNSRALPFITWPNYLVGLANLTHGNDVNSEICFWNSTYCCTFLMNWQNITFTANSQYYNYHFGLFAGYNNVTSPPILCSVFRCATEELEDCDRVIAVNTNIVFDNITIISNFTKATDYLFEPYSFNANMQLFSASNYEWKEFNESDYYGVHYFLNTTQTNLYAFSINGTGNNTNTGGGGGTGGGTGGGGGAAALAVSMFIMFSVFLVSFIA